MPYLGMGALVLSGAALQGVGGLGFALFCAPFAEMFFPQLVPGPLLLLGCPLALMALVREHRSVDWPVASAAISGRLAGTVMAAGALALLPAATMSLVFAVLILAGVSLSLMGWRVAITTRGSALAGIASGLMGTITSAGGPPLAIAFQNLPPSRLRATLGCVFFVGSAISIVALAAVGRIGWQHVWLGALLLPWLLAGFAVSNPLSRRLPAHGVRLFLLTLAACGALIVLVQAALAH